MHSPPYFSEINPPIARPSTCMSAVQEPLISKSPRKPVSSPSTTSPRQAALDHRSYNVSEHRQAGSRLRMTNGSLNGCQPLGRPLASLMGISRIGTSKNDR